MKCFLSGLEIPPGMLTVEHIAPKHWVPINIANLEENKAPAIKIFNNMKADLFLCEWYELRMGLAKHALENWNIKRAERKLIKEGMENFRHDRQPNPCEFCVCYKIAPEYCVRTR